MDRDLQFLISGITVGCIYALVSLGVTLAYRATGILNFAQGSFVMLSGLVFIAARGHAPLAVIAAMVIAFGVLLGLVTERLAIAPARKATHESLVIITIGLAEIMQGISLTRFGGKTKYTGGFVDWSTIRLGGTTIDPQDLFIVAGAIITVVLTFWGLEKTKYGRGLRASALDAEMTTLCGLSPKTVTFVTLGISGGVAAIAGLLLTPVTGMGYESGISLGINGLFAAVLGGLGSIRGALWGGIVFGLIEAATLLTVPSYSSAVSLAVVVLVLAIRPTGLTGASRARVGAL